MTAAGWKLLDLKPKTLGSTQTYKDFGNGYAVRFVTGAQHLAGCALRVDNDQPLEVADIYDGRVVVAPNPFKELEVTWPDDVFPGLTRCVVEVLTRPAIVEAAGAERGFLSARRIFPSSLHANPPSDTGIVNVPFQDFAVVADVPALLYQYPKNTGSGLSTPYLSRIHGDDRAPFWPAADLFFDGFIAGVQHNEFNVWIYAYTFSNSSLPRLHFYRRLTNIESEAASPPTTVPAQSGVHVCRFGESTGIGVPVPADGFQILVRNTSASVNLDVHGYIGARTA